MSKSNTEQQHDFFKLDEQEQKRIYEISYRENITKPLINRYIKSEDEMDNGHNRTTVHDYDKVAREVTKVLMNYDPEILQASAFKDALSSLIASNLKKNKKTNLHAAFGTHGIYLDGKDIQKSTEEAINTFNAQNGNILRTGFFPTTETDLQNLRITTTTNFSNALNEYIYDEMINKAVDIVMKEYNNNASAEEKLTQIQKTTKKVKRDFSLEFHSDKNDDKPFIMTAVNEANEKIWDTNNLRPEYIELFNKKLDNKLKKANPQPQSSISQEVENITKGINSLGEDAKKAANNLSSGFANVSSGLTSFFKKKPTTEQNKDEKMTPEEFDRFHLEEDKNNGRKSPNNQMVLPNNNKSSTEGKSK